MIKLRISGTEEEVTEYITRLKQDNSIHCLEISSQYKNRGDSEYVRVYADVDLLEKRNNVIDLILERQKKEQDDKDLLDKFILELVNERKKDEVLAKYKLVLKFTPPEQVEEALKSIKEFYEITDEELAEIRRMALESL
ncbi:MAG: hypothetical protein ACQEUT_18290 [Bacillota bacterium]